MTTKKYTPKPKDLRFLQAVDFIIAENKKLLGVLHNDSLISSAVFGKRNVISKIRSHQRGVSQEQIERFATHFDLDYNFFYKDNIPIKLGHLQCIKFVNTQESSPLVKLSGNHSGNIYNSKIYVCLEKAKQMIQAKPDAVQTDCETIIDTIRDEIQQLEGKIMDQSKKIDHMQREHDQMLIDLQNQVLEAKKKETQVMEKYIALCEKVQVSGLQITANGQSKRAHD